ncbi:MAG: class I SAM-dependent methyltransferase [Humibacillus sp.]|nr:class I SAM-dependent methyltransferase [Humibacillus sp.]MDN5777464.1 class I SAM-dependent methyltransferase [Humibacillus sp.]
MSEIDLTRALSFGSLAQEYDRWRPSYPPEAIDWLVPSGAREVADLGAGTGKLTGDLLARGLVVHAVEPDPGMLAVLRAGHPLARTHLARADALPLEAASVAAVLVAQAWHWMSPYETTVEVRRVLRPGGWLGLVWNVVDPRADWEFNVHGLTPETWRQEEAAHTVAGLPFPAHEVETAEFAWTWVGTSEAWLANIATQSSISTMPTAEREKLLAEKRAILANHLEAAGQPEAQVHHRAVCVRWRPASDAVASDQN